ncbi:MAG: hypothetical protein WAM42_14000 [Candidatus Nitrosopolaris sp.]
MTARQLHRLSVIATSWGNGCHLVVPKSWENMRVYCMLRDEYEQVREMCERNKISIEQVAAG